MQQRLWLGIVTTLLAASPSLCRGDTIYFQEDNGIVAAIPTSSPAILFASDGEASFDPFGAGFDVSDAIQFPNGAGWVPDVAGSDPLAFAPGFWQVLQDGLTWVLPAVTPGGSENEPEFEPYAKWYLPGATWNPGTPDTLLVFDGEQLSDWLTVANDGPNGDAAITFRSDPNTSPVPEPATFALVGMGAFGLVAGALRRRRRQAI